MWQKNTGGHPNIQHGRGGYDCSNYITDGSEYTMPTLEETSSHTQEHNTKKWVHNLSKTPLTEAWEKALTHGPNFAVVAKEPPIREYISQIERVCQQLKQGKVEELRGEIKSILKNS